MILVDSPAYTGFINPSFQNRKLMVINGKLFFYRFSFEKTKDINAAESAFEDRQDFKKRINVFT